MLTNCIIRAERSSLATFVRVYKVKYQSVYTIVHCIQCAHLGHSERWLLHVDAEQFDRNINLARADPCRYRFRDIYSDCWRSSFFSVWIFFAGYYLPLKRLDRLDQWRHQRVYVRYDVDASCRRFVAIWYVLKGRSPFESLKGGKGSIILQWFQSTTSTAVTSTITTTTTADSLRDLHVECLAAPASVDLSDHRRSIHGTPTEVRSVRYLAVHWRRLPTLRMKSFTSRYDLNLRPDIGVSHRSLPSRYSSTYTVE